MNRIIVASSFALAACIASPAILANSDINIPESFEYMGPEVKEIQGPDGRQIAYVDTGPSEGKPFLFIGGTGTSAAVVQVTDFLRSFREDLGIRLISVGRAGYGQTAPAEDWTFSDYATDAEAVLESLNVEDVGVMAISGGGAYASAFAEANPNRITSMHLAAATALVDLSYCDGDLSDLEESVTRYAANPLIWWSFGEDSPTKLIPGFSTAAANDGARTFGIDGQQGSGDAMMAERERYCTMELGDVSGVTAPVYIYQGLSDSVVPPSNADRWEDLFQNVAARRDYPQGGHDVQYRHWDQILIDMAGMGENVIMCREDKSVLVPQDEARTAQQNGENVGICAWGDDPH